MTATEQPTTTEPETGADDPFMSVLPALDRAHELAVDYVAGLATRPVGRGVTTVEMAAALAESLPEDGMDPGDAIAEWLARAEPGIVSSSGPRFFGWVFGGTTPAALAGDWLASAIDQAPGMWNASPAGVQTEIVVLDWLKELFGLPTAWEGTITSGATMSNLVGLAAARQWAGQRLGFDPAQDGLGGHPPIPVLSSTEIHASAVKALGTLGLGRGSVRKLPAPGGVLDLDALDDALAEIDGPTIVVANAGEVNTGAFDPIAAIANRCARHPGGAWLHVDAAFGLFAALSPGTAPLLAGVERADSVGADAHKWLNVPYDAGFAFVREADALRAAFSATGAYIAPPPDAGWDPISHVPEMSRRFRALSFWCALKAFGRSGYRAVVERCLANTADFAIWVEATPGLELAAPAHLNVVCFRATASDPAQQDALNRALVIALQRDGRVFVTGTVWDGRAAIRAAFDNWATGPRDVAILTEAISRQLFVVLRGGNMTERRSSDAQS